MSVIKGYTITRVWCRACVPEGIELNGEIVNEDHGVPYHCDDCGQELVACQHTWGTWRLAYTPEGQPPRDIRFCTQEHCGEVQYRPAEMENPATTASTREH